MKPTDYDTPTAPLGVQQVCDQYPARVKRLFQNLNLSRDGLEDVREAVQKNDYATACGALLHYYSTCPQGEEFRQPRVKHGSVTDRHADTRLSDSFHWHSTSGVVPRTKEGRLDWSYCGPRSSWEWGYNLNRHYHIDQLMKAYAETGNPRYINGIDDHLRDWISSNPYPDRKSQEDRPQWRGLEVHKRIECWLRVFYRLQNDPGLQPGTQILMLSSIPEHADYLMKYHASAGNWIAMEMNSLGTAAAYWPEFNDAPKWRDYSMNQMLQQLEEQTYPTGVQKELAMQYHFGAADSMSAFADKAEANKWKLPPDFRKLLEKMYEYPARASRPDGGQLAGNDSTLRDCSTRVLAQADRYNRDDWIYIMTNGKKGRKPEYGPSAVYPWAGHVIARNNWSRDAHWSIFDVGPWGSAHQHNDKLHISLYAHGRTLLIDGGPFTYRGDSADRRYAQGTASHNCIMIDGRGQNRYEKVWEKPMSGNYSVSDDIVFARGTVDQGFRNINGHATHTRALLYIKDALWVVVDRIDTDRPRTITPLWHFHPDCTVEIQGNEAVSVDQEKGNLRVIPVADFDLKPEILKGSTDPFQGWHSRTLGHKVPAPCAAYSANIQTSKTFAWILYPAKGHVPTLKAQLLPNGHEDIRLSVNGTEIAVCLHGAKAIKSPEGKSIHADAAVFIPGKEPIIVSTE